MELIKQIELKVKEVDDLNLWNSHIRLVRDYAIKLAKLENEDVETMEIAAILHDYGRLKYGGKDHPMTGGELALKILQMYKYPEEKVQKIVLAIKQHGSKEQEIPDFSKILRAADAMSRLETYPYLIALYMEKDMTFKYAVEKTIKKLENNWDYKIKSLGSARAMSLTMQHQAMRILKINLSLVK